MGVFEDVKLSWKGDEYVVKSTRVMGLIECIEDHITIEELNAKGVKRAKLTSAFCSALYYAGCRNVDAGDVYNSFFKEGASVDINNIITSLLMMMIPPEHLRDEEPGKEEKVSAKKKKDKG